MGVYIISFAMGIEVIYQPLCLWTPACFFRNYLVSNTTNFSLMNWLDVVGRSLSVSSDVATSTMLSSPSVTLGFVLRPSLILGFLMTRQGMFLRILNLHFSKYVAKTQRIMITDITIIKYPHSGKCSAAIGSICHLLCKSSTKLPNGKSSKLANLGGILIVSLLKGTIRFMSSQTLKSEIL